MKKTTIRQQVLSAAVLSALGISAVQASGFRVPELSTVGTGTSNALVANTDELGALPYNPAAMSFHKGKGLVAGVTYIGYDLSVDTTSQGGGPTDNVGEDSFLVPNLYFMAEGYGKWSFGLGINAPFGLETNWPAGTFPSGFPPVGGPPPLSALEPEHSKIEMINVNPNLAYKIDDNTSIAFGLMHYHLRDLIFNTQAIKINGNGSAFGWNLGFQKIVGDWNFGLSYKSSVDVDLSGTFDAIAAGAPAALAARASIEFPDMIQAGVFYQATEKLGIEVDVERTGWSSFDKIDITDATGGPLTDSTNNWDDAWAYRLGAIYQLNPKTKLLFGYAYDETGQPDAYFSARVPDNDRQLFSIGMTHDYNDWTVEASYMHVVVDDRTINSSIDYPTQAAGGNTDPNGTNAYNGTYESSVNLLSVGVSKKF